MDTQTTGTAPRPQESKPKISVIIPFFGDPRGKPRHILSWTHRQTCAAHDFEVIVLCHCIKAQWEQEIASYLRPHDRLIRARVTNGIDLYDVGARAARGEILFITEDHCVAEHSCIAEALRFFEANTDAAASMQSGHIDYTELARLEHLAYERYVVPWGLAPDHWEKVSIRGIAIRRSLYFAAGGMPGRFGPFAEALLSARLHAGGHKVGSIPAVGLRHVNMRSWPHVHVNVSSV